MTEEWEPHTWTPRKVNYSLYPHDNGHSYCPYDNNILTAIILEEKKQFRGINYVCHTCKRIFISKRREKVNIIDDYI